MSTNGRSVYYDMQIDAGVEKVPSCCPMRAELEGDLSLAGLLKALSLGQSEFSADLNRQDQSRGMCSVHQSATALIWPPECGHMYKTC